MTRWLQNHSLPGNHACNHDHGSTSVPDCPAATTTTQRSNSFTLSQSQSLISFVIVFTITVPVVRKFATRTRSKVHAQNTLLHRNEILTSGMWQRQCNSTNNTRSSSQPDHLQWHPFLPQCLFTLLLLCSHPLHSPSRPTAH